MSKTLDTVRAFPHVAFVDDERKLGNPIFVTLGEGYFFKANPDCGVETFLTVAEARSGSGASAVYQQASPAPSRAPAKAPLKPLRANARRAAQA